MKQQDDPQQNDREHRATLKAGSSQTTWETIHRRLHAVQRMIEQSGAPTPAQEKAILRDRAKAIAQKPLPTQSNLPEVEIVIFKLAHETYAFESRYIRAIQPLKELTPLPCTPPFVRGLINVHGQIVSILDLKQFFGLPTQELSHPPQAIILQQAASQPNAMQFGVVADSLLDVRRVARQRLQPSLPVLTGIRSEFLLGITPEQVIILDAGKLLASRDLIVYEEVADGLPEGSSYDRSGAMYTNTHEEVET